MSECKHIYQGKAKITVMSRGQVVRSTTVDHGKKSDRWRVRLLVNEALNNGHMVITDPVEG